MADERNLDQENRWYWEQLALRCVASLERNNIKAHYLPDREAACSKVLDMIPPGVSIGVGDSVTLLQVGIIPALEGRHCHQVFDPFRKDGESYFPPTLRQTAEIGKKAIAADVFLTGINAITLDGKLVNVDGFGNRVAGLVFGPKKVIAVAGVNKIVPDLDEALKRIKGFAAPINVKRHQLKHGLDRLPPCATSGICSDCTHPSRICCYTVIVEYQPRPRIEVVLIGEKLGI